MKLHIPIIIDILLHAVGLIFNINEPSIYGKRLACHLNVGFISSLCGSRSHDEGHHRSDKNQRKTGRNQTCRYSHLVKICDLQIAELLRHFCVRSEQQHHPASRSYTNTYPHQTVDLHAIASSRNTRISGRYPSLINRPLRIIQSAYALLTSWLCDNNKLFGAP